MKFTILQQEFSRALSMCSKSLLPRPNLPILSNVLVKAFGQKVEILATNLETASKAFLSCEVEIGGEVTLSGKTLFEFVSQLPEGDVVFEKLGEEVVISTKGFKGRFATMPAEEFPAIPEIDNGFSLEIPSGGFMDAVSKIAFCAAQDEGRPILTGVLCEISKGKLKMVATDGYRLSFKEVNIKTLGSIPSLKINIPAKALSEIARIISELDGGERGQDDKNILKLMVADSLNQISFKVENVEFTSRLIEGEYPNWQKIIPTTFNTTVKINKTEFSKLVRIASIFARDSGNIVKLKIESKTGGKVGLLTVSALSSQSGATDASCDIEASGPGGEIAFNFRYLLEILSVIGGEDINFEMNESLSPGRITSKDTKDQFFHIIMPVRLQA